MSIMKNNCIPVKDASVAGLLVEEEAEDGQVEDGQPEVDRGEVLVLLHEEVRPTDNLGSVHSVISYIFVLGMVNLYL